jgi:hypothetical protein
MKPCLQDLSTGRPKENRIVSNKPEADNNSEQDDSTVMAEQASITAERTSTSVLGDEPTYDQQVREDIEGGDFSEVTDRSDCRGNLDG